MRKSRLYLALSILSLAFGVGMAMAQHRHRHRSACEVTAPATAYDRAYDALHARDFKTMGDCALELLNERETPFAHGLYAYALRGQHKYRQAVKEYTVAIGGLEAQRGTADDLALSELADCYVGRAACLDELEESLEARSDVELAKAVAKKRIETAGSDRERAESSHYQLACALAVESTLRDGEKAAYARGQAIAELKRSIANGFDGWDHLNSDLDVDALRSESEFARLFPRRAPCASMK